MGESGAGLDQKKNVFTFFFKVDRYGGHQRVGEF